MLNGKLELRKFRRGQLGFGISELVEELRKSGVVTDEHHAVFRVWE